MDRINNKLAGDPSALVLGIVSLVIVLAGCCCGLFTIVSLTLSIVGLVMANKSLREYAMAPENYSVGSYKNVNTAKVINIIGIVLSALVLAGQIAFFAINGSKITNSIYEEWRRKQHVDFEYNVENDSADSWDEQTIELKKQGDSIVIDTIANTKSENN